MAINFSGRKKALLFILFENEVAEKAFTMVFVVLVIWKLAI